MKKVLLIQPSLYSLEALHGIIVRKAKINYNRVKYTYPLGILHIGTVLEKNNYEVKILDLDKCFFEFLHNDNIEKDINQFFKRYLAEFAFAYKPDIIGISGNFNCNKTFITKCCSTLKDMDRRIPIILGGHYPTNCYREILEKDPNVDFVVLGEGEEVMLLLLDAFSREDIAYIENHPNIVSNENILKNGHVKKMSAIVNDLESLPTINYELLDTAEDYISNPSNIRIVIPRGVETRAVVMMTSRGCPFNCTYCASHKVHGKKLRAFSVDRVVDDLEALVDKYDINGLIIEDDLFTFSKRRTIELSKKIYEKFGDRFFIEFSNGIAVSNLDEECIKLLAKAGMRQIHLAIESGSQYVQNNIIKKRLNLNKVKPVVDLLKKYNVMIRAFFIMGFPGETLDMMRDTKDFAKELKVDWAIFSFASPVVGSELYESAKTNNQLISESSDETTYFDAQLRSDDWSNQDVEAVQQEANYEVNFLGNYNITEKHYEKSLYIYSNICNDYPKHLMAQYCLWKSQMGLNDFLAARETEKEIFNILDNDENSKALVNKYNLSNAEPFVNYTPYQTNV